MTDPEEGDLFGYNVTLEQSFDIDQVSCSMLDRLTSTLYEIITNRKMCYGKAFRKLRNLFPRPYFIHTEGALDKAIYLMQPPREESTSVGLVSCLLTVKR